MTNLATCLGECVRRQSRPRGRVWHEPATIIGIALVDRFDGARVEGTSAAIFSDKPPILAVNVPSPTDPIEPITETEPSLPVFRADVLDLFES